MAMYNRERDFTEATISDIRKNLQGEIEPYRELSKWWKANGHVFDYADPTPEIRELEDYMTGLRHWMSHEAPRKLDKIVEDVTALDANYAARCDETTEEIRQYGRVVDILIETISAEDFAATFNKADAWRKIAVVAPQLQTRKAESRRFLIMLWSSMGLTTLPLCLCGGFGRGPKRPTPKRHGRSWTGCSRGR
jgi:hypothetical protein